jgi:hypothetical protein
LLINLRMVWHSSGNVSLDCCRLSFSYARYYSVRFGGANHSSRGLTSKSPNTPCDRCGQNQFIMTLIPVIYHRKSIEVRFKIISFSGVECWIPLSISSFNMMIYHRSVSAWSINMCLSAMLFFLIPLLSPNYVACKVYSNLVLLNTCWPIRTLFNSRD